MDDAAMCDAGERLRRLLLPVILGLGSLSTLIPAVARPLQGPAAWLEVAVAAGLSLGAAVVLLTRRIHASARLAVLAVAFLYLAVQLGIFLFAPAADRGDGWRLAAASSWGPVMLLIASTLFETRAGLGTVVIGYFAALAVPEALFGISRGPAALFGSLQLTGPLFLASAAATVLLVAMARQRDDYAASRNAQQVMERMAHTDALTELHNRRSLMAELTREAAMAARFGLPLTVIEFDLDNFKDINDVYGHQTGDRVLVAVARHVQGRLRATDIVGRLGGEEFLILAPGTAVPEAARLAEELRLSLAERPMAGDRAWLTASFGLTVYEQGDTAEAILARADAGLYAAKRAGRNRVEAVMATPRNKRYGGAGATGGSNG